LKPAFAPAYFSRGNAYDALDRYDRAIASFDVAIRLSPGYTTAYANRGVVYAKKGDQARAIADFKRALILDPSDPVANDNLARIGVPTPDRSARLGTGGPRMF
ncbi:MAG: tetratricopeptide repeat protein, partial [Hyphomicrobiales bacterium]|nr:tetratricopeptide repeat protein [Hyphomicrobiales bacterium]